MKIVKVKKVPFFGKKYSEESLVKLREHTKNRTKLPKPGNPVEVTDLVDGAKKSINLCVKLLES